MKEIKRILALQEAIESIHDFVCEKVFSSDEKDIKLFNLLNNRKYDFITRRNQKIKALDPNWYQELVKKGSINCVDILVSHE